MSKINNTRDTIDSAPHSGSGLSRWALSLLAFALVVCVLAGLKYYQIQQAIAFAESFPERSESVTAVSVQATTLPIRYRTMGEVQATQYLELRTEVDGRISAINFTGGESVSEGQVLIELDSREEQAQLQASNAQLKLAELQLQRTLELRKKNLVSNNDVDIAMADKDVLVANAAALTATINKKTLRAPFDAQTGVHNLHNGQYLAANSLITELSGGSGELWIDFDLPQDKATLTVGSSVEISGRELAAGAISATIVSAESRIDPVSRSRGYRALITNAPDTVRPGSALNIDVVLGQRDNVYRLPVSAVRRSNFGAFVYVLNPQDADSAAPYRAEQRAVTISTLAGNDIFIDTGIAEGELVAAIGAFKLEDNLLVHIVERADDAWNLHGDGTQQGNSAQDTVNP